MKTWIAIVLQTLFLFCLLTGAWIRIETSIAKIQTDVVWIKQELNKCRQSLEIPTH